MFSCNHDLGCITGAKLWFNKDCVNRSVDDDSKEVDRSLEEDLEKLIYAYSWRGRLDNPNSCAFFIAYFFPNVDMEI